MSVRSLLRASSEAETAFLDAGAQGPDGSDGPNGPNGATIPARWARPPRDAVLTMRMVRAAHAASSDSRASGAPRAVRALRPAIMVVEPQDYDRVTRLSHKSLVNFYPKNKRGRNERTGLWTGQGPALTGSGGDEWWVANDALVEWLKDRTRWFRRMTRSL
jgi:hypothetical protein